MSRRALAAALVLTAGAGLTCMVCVGACVLADPPPTLPVVAEEPPSIQTALVAPAVFPTTLAQWPAEFVIPVGITDPSKPLVWYAYEDYDPVANPLSVMGPISVPIGDGGPVFDIKIPGSELPIPFGPGCHTLKIVVAYGFFGTTPIAPGGDVVYWQYSGSGTTQCSEFDAGALGDATPRGDSGSGSGAGSP